MALSRVTTWVSGQVLTAAALNAEFDNLINNPVGLISPTTGAINFNNQAHTNLRLEGVATTPSPTAVGRITFDTNRTQVEVDDGTIIRSVPTINSSAMVAGQLIVAASSANSQWIGLNPGSSNKTLLIATSSASTPTWSSGPVNPQVLTSGSVTAGNLFYASTAATPVILPLTIGTSGQVLTVSTSGVPQWATIAANNSVSGALFGSTAYTWGDDFDSVTGALSSGIAYDLMTRGQGYFAAVGTALTGAQVLTTVPGGALTWPNGAAAAAHFAAYTTASTSLTTLFRPSNMLDFTVVLSKATTGATTLRAGLWSTQPASGVEPVNGIYFRTTGTSTNSWRAVSQVAGVEFTVDTSRISSTQNAALRIQLTGSGPTANVWADGTAVGTFTSSQLGTVDLGGPVMMTSNATANLCRIDMWTVSQSRSTTWN